MQSDPAEVNYGVIQGSTLGPLLFLIYVNNLSKTNIRGSLFLFADDTALVSADATWDAAYNQASSDLAILRQWFDHNTLTVNVNKTMHLPIFKRSENDPGPRSLRMHSCGDPRAVACACGVIGRVDQYKYLGVIFDHKLSWSPHVQYVKQRLRKLIFAFSQLSRVLSVEHRRTVYFAFAQSILQYGILGWGGAMPAVLEPLLVTQKLLIKTLLNKALRYPTNLLFAEFPVLSVRQLFIKNLLTYLHDKKDLIFQNIQHQHYTRNRHNFGYFIPRLSHFTQLTCSFYIAHVLYRNLPVDILEAGGGSLAAYKKRVVEWLLRIGPVNSEALIHSLYN